MSVCGLWSAAEPDQNRRGSSLCDASLYPIFEKKFYGHISVHGRDVLVPLLYIYSMIVQKISNPLLVVLSDPSCHIDSLAI